MPIESYQKEIPMIHRYLYLMSDVNCKLQAIIKYHAECEAAAIKLAKALKKCPKKPIIVKKPLTKK